MLYKESVDLFEAVEAHILGTSVKKHRISKFFWRVFVAPFRFIFRDLFELEPVISVAKFVLLFLIAVMLYDRLLTGISPEARRDIIQISLPFVLVVPLFLAIFSVPSSYMTLGIKKSYIEFVLDSIDSMSNSNEHRCDGLKSNIQLFESNVKQKINRTKVALGGLWACWVYVFWKNIDSIFSDMLMLMSFLALVALYWLTERYNRTSGIIFSAIYIGIDEWRHTYASKQNAHLTTAAPDPREGSRV